MPAARSTSRAVASSPASVTSRCAGHRGPDVAERAPRQLLDLGDLGERALALAALGQPPGQAGLDGDRGQRVAEQVVQVAGDARALVLGRQPGDLGAGRGQRDVGLDDVEEAEHRERDQQDRQRQCSR